MRAQELEEQRKPQPVQTTYAIGSHRLATYDAQGPQREGEGTFAGVRGNDGVAPKADLPCLTPERRGSTLSGHLVRRMEFENSCNAPGLSGHWAWDRSGALPRWSSCGQHFPLLTDPVVARRAHHRQPCRAARRTVSGSRVSLPARQRRGSGRGQGRVLPSGCPAPSRPGCSRRGPLAASRRRWCRSLAHVPVESG
jgi:hypothetical protein